MSDYIKYDYDSMDVAYDEMKRISDAVIAQLDVLQQEAERVLAFNGDYVTNYDQKAQKVRDGITELNDATLKRSNDLAEKFADYQATDKKLGAR
ncbi:WXG100 family type VII secretion target [Micromonospora sp. 067-2]|uniref:WXG100 family type VII secretion target n=1 Tax=Micromonospora sp. 067-2 TaxID=2789270 RepID=UPI00397CC340